MEEGCFMETGQQGLPTAVSRSPFPRLCWLAAVLDACPPLLCVPLCCKLVSQGWGSHVVVGSLDLF